MPPLPGVISVTTSNCMKLHGATAYVGKWFNVEKFLIPLHLFLLNAITGNKFLIP
jgi:hypothetical protein